MTLRRTRFILRAFAGITLLIAPFAVTTVRAESVTSALINRQLDSRQDLDLNGTLLQAIDLIEKKTGVHIEVDGEVWDTLPWGRDTTVAATVRNAPLRDALSAITSKLGLGFRLTDRAVQLSLLPPLDRLDRRAELPELDVLAVLQQTPWPANLARPTMQLLCDAIDHELSTRKNPFATEDRAADAVRKQLIDLPRNATLYDALEAVNRQTSATWYPSGKTLFLVPKQDVYRRKLNRRVTARYDGVDVPQVLLELFQRESVPFEIEPDAYARVPAKQRSVRLLLQDTPLREALQSISGETGLKFEATDRGVYVSNPTAATKPTTAPTTKTTTAPTTKDARLKTK